MANLLFLSSQAEYQSKYEELYCNKPLLMAENIPIIFRKQTFYHAFFESKEKKDDYFSFQRSQRLLFIQEILENNNLRYQGWISDKKRFDISRIVSVMNNFVVVIGLNYNKSKKEVQGNFITCYYAITRIAKLYDSPIWTKDLYFNYLENKKALICQAGSTLQKP